VAAATREPALKREQIEQHKQAMEARRDRVVDDVNELKDVRSRLRREGPRLAAIGGAVVLLVAGSLILRAVVKSRRQEEQPLAAGGDASLDSLVAEIRALREEMGKQRKSGSTGGLAGKLAATAVTAAASSAGKQAANRFIERQEAAAR
jgi:hypothetical protein